MSSTAISGASPLKVTVPVMEASLLSVAAATATGAGSLAVWLLSGAGSAARPPPSSSSSSPPPGGQRQHHGHAHEDQPEAGHEARG